MREFLITQVLWQDGMTEPELRLYGKLRRYRNHLIMEEDDLDYFVSRLKERVCDMDMRVVDGKLVPAVTVELQDDGTNCQIICRHRGTITLYLKQVL